MTSPFAPGDAVTAQQLNRSVPKRINLTANQTVTSNTTLQNTALAIAVEANRRYDFTIKIFYRASTTGDFKPGLSLPTGATVIYEANSLEGGAASATGATYRGAFTAVTGASAGGIGGSTDVSATISGTIITAANSGTVTFQFAQNTSDGTATQLTAGSWMELLDAT
jgi:hypothetical protein